MAFGGAPVTVLAEIFSAPLGAKFFSLGSDLSDVNVFNTLGEINQLLSVTQTLVWKGII